MYEQIRHTTQNLQANTTSLSASGGQYAFKNVRKAAWMRKLVLSEGGASSNELAHETDCIARDGAEDVRLTHVHLGEAHHQQLNKLMHKFVNRIKK
jgi:hypothetical protein